MDNIKTDIDYNYSINTVLKDLELNIELQDKNVLDSNKFNTSMASIEKYLNNLYENSRHIEDAIEYTKSFLDIKIKEYSKEIKTIFKQIEDIRDSNKEAGYIEYDILFNDYCNSYDRDNSTLKPCLIKDNNLVLNNKSEELIKPKNFSCKSNSVAYTSNLEDLLLNKEYRTVFIEEKIVTGGIVNTVTIKLDKITNINYLDIKAVNSKVKNIRYVYSNGLEDEVKDSIGITNNKLVAYIKFDLVCDTYKASTYYLDKTKITDST